MSKLAVVLFNLGGPDRLQSVKPFLFNLFNDPAIIGGAKPFRWAMAKFMSHRRAKVAREIYRKLDGKSPLLDETRAQAEALQRKLTDQADDVRVFIAMRYWHPMSGDVAREVKRLTADLGHEREHKRLQAIEKLGRIGKSAAVVLPKLMKILQSGEPTAQVIAARAVPRIAR